MGKVKRLQGDGDIDSDYAEHLQEMEAADVLEKCSARTKAIDDKTARCS